MKFRQIGLTALLTLGIFSAVTYTSCTKDSSCPSGFSGKNCETAWSTPFVGTWTANETCSGSNRNPYQIIITGNATNPTQLLISNLGNYACSATGDIQFNGTLTAPVTFTVNDNQCGLQMNASGTLNTSNNQITISFTASYLDSANVTVINNCTSILNQ